MCAKSSWSTKVKGAKSTYLYIYSSDFPLGVCNDHLKDVVSIAVSIKLLLEWTPSFRSVDNDFILHVWMRVKGFGSDHSHPSGTFSLRVLSVMWWICPWQERNFIIVIICSYCFAFLQHESMQQSGLWNHLVFLDRVIWTLAVRGIWKEDALWYFWPRLTVLMLQMNGSLLILRPNFTKPLASN